MKLDSKEKYERIRRFASELKLRPNIDPFLCTEDIAKFGIYDFCYITKNLNSFAKVEKKLKDSKYNLLEEFTGDLKQIFIVVSDYAFQDDPIQQTVDHFCHQIDQFALKFTQDFAITLVRPRPQIELPPQRPKPQEPKAPKVPVVVQQEDVVQSIRKELPKTSLVEKLQMLFLLRGNENNEAKIRSIAELYNIGQDVADEYVVTLEDRNNSWIQFLNQRN